MCAHAVSMVCLYLSWPPVVIWRANHGAGRSTLPVRQSGDGAPMLGFASLRRMPDTTQSTLAFATRDTCVCSAASVVRFATQCPHSALLDLATKPAAVPATSEMRAGLLRISASNSGIKVLSRMGGRYFNVLVQVCWSAVLCFIIIIIIMPPIGLMKSCHARRVCSWMSLVYRICSCGFN